MSELVNKIHSLKQKVSELKEEVATERARYVDEVDHSDEMAFLLEDMKTFADERFGTEISRLLRNHAHRRASDDSLPALSLADDE